MGLPELFLAVLIIGISAVNAGVPVVAWRQGNDPRFLLLAAASVALAALGALWTWGQLPVGPPSYTAVQLPELGVVLLATLLLLAASLWPRRA